MADVNTAETNAKADAAFAVGFGDTPPAEVVKVVEAPAADPEKPEPVVPVSVPEKPRYVRLTEQEWGNAKANLGKVSALESQVAKLTGSIPKAEQIVQQAVEAIRAQTPAGAKVTVTPEDFAELGADFEEVSGMTIKGLQRVLDRFNVTGTSAGATADPDAIEKVVEATLKKRADAETAATREKEMTGLLEVYPDWGKIVGQPTAMGTKEPVETDWRKWATTNDHAALKTDSPAEVKASIDRFIASQTPSPTPRPDRAAARRAVIADAQTPRAEGNAPPLNQPQTAEDAFSGGFKAVKRA